MKRFRDLAIIALLILSLSSVMESCSGGGGGSSTTSNVPPVTDTTPPTVPAGLTTIATSTSQISIAWSASWDAVGVAGYKVYRGGTYLKSVATISTLDSNLTASTQYCYQVSAYDAAGNESAHCTQICAITLPVASQPTPVCNASGNQYGVRLIKVIDGYIVAWQDERRVYRDIYAQKFDVDGNMKWANNGRVIAEGNDGEASNHLLYNSQSLTGMVSDTQGGAIALWTEDYSCASGPCGNGWITRVSSSGNVQWGAPPATGVTIQGMDTAVPLNQPSQGVHADAIAPDGQGGAFVIQDYDAWGSWNVFRLDSNGALRSITSTVIGMRAASQMIYGGNTNGKDYVSIAWWDVYSGGDFAINIVDPEASYPASTDTLYAPWLKSTLTSTPAWWSEPSLTSDGAGGMIIAWEDSRNGNSDVFAQKIGADGSVQWTPNGVPISVQTGDQRFPQLVSDGAGGAVIVWQDQRDPSTTRIYAQRVGANGSTMWAADGIPISSIYGESPKVIASEDGTVIVVWFDTDLNGGTPDYLRAQKVDMTGTLLWPLDSRTPSGGTTGTVISEIYSADFDIASDGSSGLIAVWTLGGDIDMRRVMSDGTVR